MSDVEMEVNLAWQEEEESSLPEGLKWTSLTHKGPLFPPEYEPLPDDVRWENACVDWNPRADVKYNKRRLYYNNRPFALSLKAEEAATMFAALLDTVHVSKPVHMMTLNNACKYKICRFK